MIPLGRPPGWAVALVEQACASEGLPAPARLRWRRVAREASSGSTRLHDSTISVSAGRDPVDARLTLLHELAHWLVGGVGGKQRRGRGSTRHHDARFWERAFALYRSHGISARDALRLEARRYPGALRYGAALGVTGADEQLAAHRRALAARPRRRWRVAVPDHRIRLARAGRWTVCATCGHRIVGRQLARLRRARRVAVHRLLSAVPAADLPLA